MTKPLRLDDWNLLRAFLAVHEHGTLTAAAEAIGSTQPTLGRHIRDLEALAGETLFDRVPGKLRLTQRGALLLQQLAPLSASVGPFEQALFCTPDAVGGTVRITTSEIFGALRLPGLLAPLLRDEPQLKIEVQAVDTVANIVRREADIAIRFFRPEQDDVIAISVGQTELGVYASPGFVESLRPGFSPNDLRGHFIGELGLERTKRISAGAGFPLTESDFRYLTDSTMGIVTAIEQGIGVGALVAAYVEGHPGLRRLFPEVLSHPMGVWLCAHEDLRRSPRLRRVFDHLAETLKQALRS